MMYHQAILQFIHPHDFDYSLALVSRSFRLAVEAHFYKYIAIPEKRLLLFCRTILARPDLARRVQRLAFTGAVLHREPEAADTDMVAETMRQLVNLKDLSITTSNHPQRAGSVVHHEDVRILHGCTFRLERLACFFSWTEAFVQWLADEQPQLRAFEHDGYYSRVVVQVPAPFLRSVSYLRISPHILASFEGHEKPQPVVLRFDMCFMTVQEEFEAAHSLRDICRNLKCLTLTRQASDEEYLSTSRILRTFADKAPNLTCLALYENIDYVRCVVCLIQWGPNPHPLNPDSRQARINVYCVSSKSILQSCRCSYGLRSTISPSRRTKTASRRPLPSPVFQSRRVRRTRCTRSTRLSDTPLPCSTQCLPCACSSPSARAHATYGAAGHNWKTQRLRVHLNARRCRYVSQRTRSAL